MNDIYCPYCGAPMDFRILGIQNNTFVYVCKTCGAQSPKTTGQPQEYTIEMAKKRMPTEPYLYTERAILEDDVIPTVIYAEKRGCEPIAGVWQQDHYEMEDGSVMDAPSEEIAQLPNTYNVMWRIWDMYPDKRYREDEPWKGDEEA